MAQFQILYTSIFVAPLLFVRFLPPLFSPSRSPVLLWRIRYGVVGHTSPVKTSVIGKPHQMCPGPKTTLTFLG